MDENAKRRLVGAAVLVALMVIFVPMLVDRKDDNELGEPIVIPNPPAFDQRFDSSLEPRPDEFGLPPRQPVPESASRPGASANAPAPSASMAPASPGDSGTSDGIDLRPGAARREPEQVAPQPITPLAPAAQSNSPSPSKPVPAPPSRQQVQSPPAPRSPAASGPVPVPAGVQSWVVQVASLSMADAAQRLRDQLRGKGYPAFIEQADINGATFYRVRVGPEVDRARADRMATAIGADIGGVPLVQQYR
jgi:DedD protein